MRPLRVHPDPASLNPAELEGGLAIVIDLLRASTTIVHALASGAASIAPCESIEKARDIAATLPPGSFLLGGERHGIRIDGFDLGNSPTEYTPERVRGKTIVFTTTNGTVALHRAEPAARVLFGCFANLSAVVAAARSSDLAFHLICAGINGEPCREDSICAGAIASAMVDQGLAPQSADTAATIELWRSIPPTPAGLTAALRSSEGGRNLISANLDADIPVCAAIDTRPNVPSWDRNSRQVL